MHLRKLTLAGAVACGLGFGVLAGSPALAVCDAYSGNCVPPTDIGGQTEQPGKGQNPTDTGTDTDAGTDTGTGTDAGTDTAAGGAGAGPGGISPNSTTSQPSTLPFTGGEIVLLTVIGAGALAGGTALVVAGRRKAQAAV